MDVSETLVRHVARLARLELSDAEVAALGPQLTRILAHVDAMASIEVAGADPSVLPAVPLSSLRPDVPAPSLVRRDLLANAPSHDQVFFLVPRVLGDD